MPYHFPIVGQKMQAQFHLPKSKMEIHRQPVKIDGDVNAITSKDLSFHTPTNVSPGKIAAAKGRKSNSRKKGSQKEQLRNRNSKSATSPKGFGASLQTGKPDGFLFTFREKLFIYAQKGIQASF